MEELFQQFTRERQYVNNVSPRTLETYGWAWKAFAPVLSGRACVSKMDVLKRIEELRAGGLSPVSVNTYLRSVNAFCHWLYEEGHSPSLVRIPRLKERQSVLATFAQEQVAKLVAYRGSTWTEKRIPILACLILDTGLRINEALCLHPSRLCCCGESISSRIP